MLPNILDFEASGFGYESYPIEVGVALTNGERFCTLIQPLEAWEHWDENAQRVHNIARQDLYRFGLPVTDVCARLNQLLAEQTAYCDGWVVDKPWLIKLFDAASMAPSFSLSPIESIQSAGQQQVWNEVKAELLDKFAFDRHRASHDALLIQETFKATRYLSSSVG
jgi:hypothetical protein